MLGFFVRFGSMVATLAGGLALVGAFGGCGPATGTCSADHHTVLDATQKVIATCTTAQACSSGGTGGADGGAASSTGGACAVCDPTLCLPMNQCILGWQNYDDYIKTNTANETTECRLTCNAQSDCPFNYHCVPGTGTTNYCINDRTAYKPKAVGEAAAGLPWGAPCSGQMGGGGNGPLANNPACDTSQQFWCYGISPTDGNAYCTQEQCNDDGDCPGGWWCATVNDSPDVRSTKRTDYAAPGMASLTSGGLTTVCMPRGYNLKPGTFCAPCKTDLDCPPNEDTPQHCLSADNNGGAEKTCAVECTTSANCPDDYICASAAGVTNNVCLPRAATCTGNQMFCSPCHSDLDCDPVNGYCIIADYSTEHYCTSLSTTTCSVTNNMLTDACPTSTMTPTNAGVSCSYDTTDFTFPQNQCFGLVNFGQGTADAAMVGGCWTAHCVASTGTCAQDSDCCSNSCAAGKTCN